MKTRNRLFAALLALVMLAGLLPVAALAEGDLTPTSIDLSTSPNRNWCKPTEKYEAFFSVVGGPAPLTAIRVMLDDVEVGFEYGMDGVSGTVELNDPNPLYRLADGKHTLEIFFSGTAALAPCSKTFTFTVGEPYNLKSQITPAGAGTVTFKKAGVEVTQAFEGDSLTVTWTPTDGYVRDNFGLTSSGGPVSIIPNDTGNPVISWSFTMPGADVTANASFKKATSIDLSTSPNRNWCKPTEKYEAHFSVVGGPAPLTAIRVELDGVDVTSECGMDGVSGSVVLNDPSNPLSTGEHMLEIFFLGTATLAPSSTTFTFKVARVHADPGEQDFATADFGYDAIGPRPVTLRNDTNSPITVTGISGAANYEAAFVGSAGPLSLPITISSDENATIAVNPKSDLAPGTYNETLTVAYNDGTDQTLSVALRFTVMGTPPQPTTKHTVTFKDGDKTLFTQAVVDGGNAIRPDSDPEKEGGYRFDGWYADDAYNSPFDFENTAITQDTDVFARFVKYYIIKFNLNGGSFRNGGATQDIERDEGERIPIPLWEEDLEYWLAPPADSEYIGVEIDGDFYAPGDIYNVVNNTTVKVRWRSTLQPATYTVGFDANGHGTAPAAQTVKSGEAATKPADPAETGWKFEGWYLDSGCTKAYDFATKVTSDITLYAKWTQDGGDPVSTTSTITFDLGGGTLNGKTGIVTIQAENGTTITLPAPTRKGYTFDYWEGSRYNAGDSYTVNGDHTLTARWKQNSTPVPRTGDESHPALWLSVLLLSAVAMIILLLYARKRKTER